MPNPNPSPSLAQARSYLNAWNQKPLVYLADDVLNRLFLKTHPKNNDLEEVLVKVCTLNSLYNTRIRNIDLLGVAQHIVSLDIDDRLAADDLNLVTDISVVGNGIYRCYSFASKYCSFHRPNAYSIYDGIVDATLWHFYKRDKFKTFHRQDLCDYSKFIGIVDSFQSFYKLDSLSRKELDMYLWLIGQDLGIYNI